jgi:hypothetical protein
MLSDILKVVLAKFIVATAPMRHGAIGARSAPDDLALTFPPVGSNPRSTAMDSHETHEQIHQAAHGHGHAPGNKKVAILIVVLAALLALVEAGGKNAQTHALTSNIQSSNLWNFFQAKTIRMTVLQAAADLLEAEGTDGMPAAKAETFQKRITSWRETAQRYDSEPSTNEGRKELMARARIAETDRDEDLSAYHMFEFGAAALQLAIVLASASIISEMIALAFLAAGLGALGTGLGLLGGFAPTLVHL